MVKLNVKLEDAMNMKCENFASINWDISRFYIRHLKVFEGRYLRLFVSKSHNGKILVGVQEEEPNGISISLIYKADNIEELKAKFPELFKLYGNVYVISIS